MREAQPSRTAALVALWRALAHDGHTSIPHFDDATASAQLPPCFARVYAHLTRRPLTGRAGQQFAQAIDLMVLRTLRLDAVVTDAVARGVRQVVLLGAGLDGRAYRMASLRDAVVFEVDHAATQAYKIARAHQLKPSCARVAFVAVDFERDVALQRALSAAGHDASVPTVWIWEGVVMYLTPAAMHTTLRALAACSAPSSTLAVHYHTQLRSALASALLRAWSEPQIHALSAAQLASALASVGFAVESDDAAPQWAAQFGGSAPATFELARSTRIAVAVA